MRILLAMDEPPDPRRGGPKTLLRLQAALRELGHHCDTLFSPHMGNWPRHHNRRMAVSPALAWAAARAAARRAGGYDVVDISDSEGAWMARWRAVPSRPNGGRPAALVARSHGLEHRYYEQLLADHAAGLIHKPWTRRLWYPWARLRRVQSALRGCDHAIFVNQADLSYSCSHGWVRPERATVIPHGIPAERCRTAPAPGVCRGGGLLFCGWWTHTKGRHYLAAAHRILLERHHAIPLTLLGVGADEPLAAIEARVRADFASASQPWLRIRPRTEDEDAVFEHYRNHDLLLCPSTSEGFGLVVVEAMSQRLPVICTQIVGAAELFRDREEITLVPPRNPEALANAIHELWTDEPRRRRLAEAGYRRVQSLTWGHTAAATLAAYETALAHRRP